MGERKDYETSRDELIADAAEAVELIGEDELERAARAAVVRARLAALPPARLDAILAEVVELLEHDGDTDPAKYEDAADRFFAAIRAAGEGEEP